MGIRIINQSQRRDIMKKLLVAALLLIGAQAFGLDAVTDADFEAKVLKSKGIVIMVAGSVNCPPCQMYKPNVESASKKLADKAKFYDMDADKNMAIDQTLGLQATPTTYVFKDGEIVYAWSGAVALEKELVEVLSNIINNADKLLANIKKQMALFEQVTAIRKESAELIKPGSTKEQPEEKAEGSQE